MPEIPDISPITNLLDKLIIMLRRPQVFTQVAVALVIVFAARSLSAIFWLSFEPRIRHRIDLRRRNWGKSFAQFILAFAKAATFSVLCIIAYTIAAGMLSRVGQTSGLLLRLQSIFWLILFFQLVIVTLYAFLGEQCMRPYHYRFLLPLMYVLILLDLLSTLVNVRDLTRVVLLTLFNNPVTLGALLIATIGLYFWMNGTHLVQEILLWAIGRFGSADTGSAEATLTVLRYILIIAAIVFALSQLRLDPTTIAAITGGLSVGVGFALQTVLSNFISGLLLLFERSLQPGDVIEIDNQISVVENLSIRATKIRTLDNVEVVIPNQTFLTSSIRTYTGTATTVRAPMTVHTSCDNDLEETIQLLIDTANQHEEVLTEPPTTVFFQSFGDNVIEYQLNIWLDKPTTIPRVQSEVRRLIWAAFKEQNIDLTFPDMALHFPETMPSIALASGQ